MDKIFFCLLFSVSLSFSSAQDIISVLKNKSESYFAGRQRTKLAITFNQPSYAPGDTVRFGVAYLNAADLKPAVGRQIIHVCLFDQFGKKKLTRWVNMGNGYSSNVMAIPKDFPPGNYRLVAFTDWMKNFDSSLYFQEQFIIAGKFSIDQTLPNDTLIFFPEGGSLVANLENKVAVRYTGKTDNIKVKLLEGERELTTTRIIKDSVQLFQFTPQLNSKYVAEINTENGVKRFALPLVKATGVVVHVDATEPRIKLTTEYSTNGNSDQENLYVAVFTNRGLIFQSSLNFDNNRRSNLLLPADLPRGIAQLIIFDSKFNLLATRVIHSGGINEEEVSLDNLQDNYSTRQEVKLTLKIKDKDGFTKPGFYSCRVVTENLLTNSEINEMDYLTFKSDISNSFGLKKDQATPQTINSYLISQSCPWFVWSNLAKGDNATLVKPQQNLTLSGTATYAKNGKHVADSTFIMFFLEKGLLGYETLTDKNGHFSFPLLLAVNYPDRFYYTATLKGKDIDDVAVQMYDADSTLSFFADPYSNNTRSLDQYAAYSSQVQAINGSYTFFKNAVPTDSVEEPNKAMEEELSGADLTVNLSDYLVMPTMEDVVREILRFVEYRKINGRQVVRVYTIGRITNHNSGPLFVIDGVVTKDPSYFLELKPADVISIKVVRDSKKLFALGNLGANGVILVKTKLHTKIVKEKHTIDFAGMLPESHNSFLGYANPKIPDLRASLFWISQPFQTNEGERLFFKTSDDIGKCKIQISGLTEDGIPFYRAYPFQVKYPGN